MDSGTSHNERPQSPSLSLPDRLFARFMARSLSVSAQEQLDLRLRRQSERPPFSVHIMDQNFRLMMSRMTILYDIYYAVKEFLIWKRPEVTLSVLLLYTHICMNPQLLVVLPLALFIVGVMVPAYAKRHPPEPVNVGSNPAPAKGPPLREAAVPKPVPDFSREFLFNLVDTQNLMQDYTVAYDFIVEFLTTFAFFVDEPKSSLIFIILTGSIIPLYILTPILYTIVPWRITFMITGWIALTLSSPVGLVLMDTVDFDFVKWAKQFDAKLNLIAKEFDFQSDREEREVEVFELQEFDYANNQWGPSLFTPDPYRITAFSLSIVRPRGVHELDHVLPPVEWEFKGPEWHLDYFPLDWIKTHKIDNVTDVDQEFKWVYDDDKSTGQRHPQWRRRRYVRTCVRTDTTKS